MQRKLILASKSPRRQKILRDMGLDFDVIPSNFEEDILLDKNFKPEMITDIAYHKANDIASKTGKSALILGADTVVVYNKTIFGKPYNYENAFKMLASLSGNKHYVVTGVCLIDNFTGLVDKRYAITYVTFNKLNKEMINNYIYKYRPFDKAGAFGIQELGKDFIKSVEGDTDNVIGLPSNIVKAMLRNAYHSYFIKNE